LNRREDPEEYEEEWEEEEEGWDDEDWDEVSQSALERADKPTTRGAEREEDIFAGVGRNDPCPCGSGKKFKYCHGRIRRR